MHKAVLVIVLEQIKSGKNGVEEWKIWSDFQKDSWELNLALPAANTYIGSDSNLFLVFYPIIVSYYWMSVEKENKELSSEMITTQNN